MQKLFAFNNNGAQPNATNSNGSGERNVHRVGPGGDYNVMSVNAIKDQPLPVHLVDELVASSNIKFNCQDADLKEVGGFRVPHYGQRYSRKVFIGGLPHDIQEEVIYHTFSPFGVLQVHLPHKTERQFVIPPKGFAFIIYTDERSVQRLINACETRNGNLYMTIISDMEDKTVQIRPWCLADAYYSINAAIRAEPRTTIFVSGLPRPLKAIDLARVIDRMYGGVCIAKIDIDALYKYPKTTARICFASKQSFIAAISARIMHLHLSEGRKRVEVKPDVRSGQICDVCKGQYSLGQFAPFFCPNIMCLQYLCVPCWTMRHSRAGWEYHKTLVQEGFTVRL